jgi:RNA polymerase-binding transcription factor DksA
MNKKLLLELKQKLEKERAIIEEQLKRFAKKDGKLKGNWNTRFPHWGSETGGAGLEKAADEVEEYEARLPVEYSLELKLKNINLALEKNKKGKYGMCEKCGKKIAERRLKIYPEARFCRECRK